MIVSLSRSMEDARWVTGFLAASSAGIELVRPNDVNRCERTALGYDMSEQAQQEE